MSTNAPGVLGMEALSPTSTYALAFVLMLTTSAVCLLWHCREVCMRLCGIGRNQQEDVEEGSRDTFEPTVTGAPQYIIRRLPVFKYNPERLLQKEASKDQQRADAAPDGVSAQRTPSCCKPPPAAQQEAAAQAPPADSADAPGQEGPLAAPPRPWLIRSCEQPPTGAAAAAGGSPQQQATPSAAAAAAGGHIVVSFTRDSKGVHATVEPPAAEPPQPAEAATAAAGKACCSSSGASSSGSSSSGEPSPQSDTPAATAAAGGGAPAAGGGLPYSSFRDDQGSCVVCFEDYVPGELLKELPCGHWYHAPCIDAWLKRNASCPLCKKVVWRPLPSDALPLWHELLRLGLVSPDFLLARSNSSRGRRGASQSAEGGPGGDGSGRGSNRVGSGIGRARSFIGV